MSYCHQSIHDQKSYTGWAKKKLLTFFLAIFFELPPLFKIPRSAPGIICSHTCNLWVSLRTKEAQLQKPEKSNPCDHALTSSQIHPLFIYRKCKYNYTFNLHAIIISLKIIHQAIRHYRILHLFVTQRKLTTSSLTFLSKANMPRGISTAQLATHYCE